MTDRPMTQEVLVDDSKVKLRYVGPHDPCEYPVTTRAWTSDHAGWAECRPGDVVEVDAGVAHGRPFQPAVFAVHDPDTGRQVGTWSPSDDELFPPAGTRDEPIQPQVTGIGGLLDQVDCWRLEDPGYGSATKADLAGEIARRHFHRHGDVLDVDELSAGTKGELLEVLQWDDAVVEPAPPADDADPDPVDDPPTDPDPVDSSTDAPEGETR